VNHHAEKTNAILLLLLLLFVLNSPLDALDERLNGLATSQRHGATSDGTAVLDLETKSLSDHGKTAIPQSDCKAAQTLLQLRRVEDALDDVLLLFSA
jgi:hypothetical protein